jgi:superfamily II DNA or RNA helicase
VSKLRVKETASYLVLEGDFDALKKLRHAYRLRPPDYWRSPRYQLYKQTEGEKGWDGYLYPFEILSKSVGRMMRGHLEDLKIKAPDLDIELDLSGVIPRPYASIVADDIPDDIVDDPNPPYPHQVEAVVQWMRAGIGINEITVSGGKTRTFCMAAAVVKRRSPKCRVLYLCSTERLVSQAYKDAKGFLPEWHITQFGGGKRDNTGTDMVVATYAIVGKNFHELRDWLKTFMILIVDECHHASSPTLEKIIPAVPAFFKFGASDSAKEDDVIRGFKIRGLLGPVLTEVTAGPLIQQQKLAKPLIYIVDNPEWQNKFDDLPQQAEKDTPAWAYINSEWKQGVYLGPAVERHRDGTPRQTRTGEEIPMLNMHRLQIGQVELDVESRWCLLHRQNDRGIIRFRDRNNLIRDWATYFSGQQKKTLVVATRTLHILILQAAIEEKIGESLTKILFSEHTSKERDAAFDWFRETPGGVLITPLVKEGVSINQITAGIIADYVGSLDVAKQLIGRFIRKKPEGVENKAEVVWFMDRQVPSYRRGCMNLFRELQRIRGYEFYHPVIEPGSQDLALRYEPASDRE